MRQNIFWKTVTRMMVLGLGCSSLTVAHGLTAGEFAEKLTFGGSLIAMLMHAVSIIMGVTLMIMSGAFYKSHRDNPKFIPIERPITYLILGLVLLALPYASRILGNTRQPLMQSQTMPTTVPAYDPDAPLECEED